MARPRVRWSTPGPMVQRRHEDAKFQSRRAVCHRRAPVAGPDQSRINGTGTVADAVFEVRLSRVTTAVTLGTGVPGSPKTVAAEYFARHLRRECRREHHRQDGRQLTGVVGLRLHHRRVAFLAADGSRAPKIDPVISPRWITIRRPRAAADAMGNRKRSRSSPARPNERGVNVARERRSFQLVR